MTKSTLMEFPCLFPVKIIGTNSTQFLDEIKQIVLKHFPDFDPKNLSHKVSDKNNYLAITVSVLAKNQESLDAFYREITQHPDIKMVL